MKQTKTRESRRTPKDPLSDALKKMGSISEATQVLASEVKTMSKIFMENQKILISLKNMIDGVNSSLDQIQKSSRQIGVLEEDTQRLFHGMSQVKAHSNLIEKINSQIDRLQDQVSKIHQKQEEIPDVDKLMKSMADNLDSTRNNTKMIMHLSDKTEKIREEVKTAAAKSESLADLGSEIEEVRKSTKELADKAASLAGLHVEIEKVKKNTEGIFEKADKVSHLEENISNLKTEVGKIVAKTESISGLDSQIRNVGAEIDALIRKTESLGSIGNDIRNVNAEFSSFKENVLGKTKELEEKMSDFAETMNRNSASISEFNKTTYEISQQLNDIRGITHKTSQNTSREVMGLLRLSEFQSNIRMRSESKYGSLEDIQKMVSQTVDMVNLFDRLSIEAETKMPLPLEVKQWSVAKILDCADRWEIRFTDVFRMLITELGADLVKESLRMEQVRDLFGIRAVDEVRHELNIA
ncbi:MAG TPA: chemotaxis protein [Candidatus Nitrosotalea sp.]|nr:chemotaxis protein [Candidatus Nitrosotalea sp.]